MIIELIVAFPVNAFAAWVWRAGPVGTNFPGTLNWPQALHLPQLSATDSETLYFYGGGHNGGANRGERMFETLWKLNTTAVEWSHLYGNLSTMDSAPTYGSFLTFNPAVSPGARYAGSAFYDSVSNSFFVGSGARQMNSMFQFNVSSQLWRWCAGAQRPNPNFYDTTPGMPPTSRGLEQTFYDPELRQLFVFGGMLSANSAINDMWRFDANDISSWTVIRTTGSSVPAAVVFGEKGIPGDDVIPNARYAATGAYSTKLKTYFMFGGNGEDVSGVVGPLADFWSYSVVTRQWTFLGGSKQASYKGNYGQIGIPSADFLPRSREMGYASVSKSGYLYFFGGRYSKDGGLVNYHQLSDLWKYNISSTEWTLLSGNQMPDLTAKTDGVGIEAYENIPAARSGGIAFYDEKSDSFNIWGGKAEYSDNHLVYSDMWAFFDRPIPTNETAIVSRRESAPISNTIIIAVLSAMCGGAFLLIISYFIKQYVGSSRTNDKGVENIIYSDGYTTTNVESGLTTTGTSVSVHTIMAQNEGLEIPGYLEVSGEDFMYVSSIAVGGGGEVFMAVPVSESLKQHCVMMVAKVIHDQASFHQEVSIMHLLSRSAYIAKLIGFCTNPCVILMKYYELGSLERYVEQNNETMSSGLKLQLCLDIARGISDLHGCGISHNDLKPQNILVDFLNGRPSCVLTDFGISYVLSSTLLSVKAFNVILLQGFSCRYAAPEAIIRFRTKVPVNMASSQIYMTADVYSIASVYYFMVTNLQPWI